MYGPQFFLTDLRYGYKDQLIMCKKRRKKVRNEVSIKHILIRYKLVQECVGVFLSISRHVSLKVSNKERTLMACKMQTKQESIKKRRGPSPGDRLPQLSQGLKRNKCRIDRVQRYNSPERHGRLRTNTLPGPAVRSL